MAVGNTTLPVALRVRVGVVEMVKDAVGEAERVECRLAVPPPPPPEVGEGEEEGEEVGKAGEGED